MAGDAKMPLQAVVLAEGFEESGSLHDAVGGESRAQLQLLGAPLLQHTLSLLRRNSVEEALILCSRRSARWIADLPAPRDLELRPVPTDGCETEGEALRTLDSRNLIRSDFILARAGALGNADLSAALSAHCARRRKDKFCIATLSLKQTSLAHKLSRTGRRAHTPIAAIDPRSHRLLQWEETPCNLNPHDGTLKVDSDTAAECTGGADAVQIMYDIEDCGVDICAPDVLWALTDNFDWQSLRSGFLCGTLKEPELGHKVHAHFVSEGELLCTVSDLRSYDRAVRDIVRRMAFPICLDNPHSWTLKALRDDRELSRHRALTPRRGNLYIHPSASLADSAMAKRGSVLLESSNVHGNAQLVGSVVGYGSVIESGAVLRRCYVGNNVRIGSNAKATAALIGDGAAVHEGACIHRDCVVASGMTVTNNVTLPAGSRLRLTESISESECERSCSWPDSLMPVPNEALHDIARVPEEARKDDDEYTEECTQGVARSLVNARAGQEQDGETQQSDTHNMQSHSIEYDDRAEVVEHATGENSTMGETAFAKEVMETVLRCLDENDERNIVVELQGLKLAEDRSFSDLARFAVITLISLALPPPPQISKEYTSLYASNIPAEKRQLLFGPKKRLKSWSSLLQRFLKSEEDQVEVLLTLEEFCAEEEHFEASGGSAFKSVFPHLLNILYEMDIIGESALLRWESEKEGAEESERGLLKLASPFLEWLKVITLDGTCIVDGYIANISCEDSVCATPSHRKQKRKKRKKRTRRKMMTRNRVRVAKGEPV